MTGSQQRSSNLYIQRCFWVQRNGCQWRAQKHSNEWPWESSWEIAGAVLRSLCAPHNKNYSSFKPTVARWISKLYWSWSSWLRTNFLCPLDNFSQHNVEPSPGACAVPGLCCCCCVPLLTLEEISVPHTFSWKETTNQTITHRLLLFLSGWAGSQHDSSQSYLTFLQEWQSGHPQKRSWPYIYIYVYI